jgi:hypothetical protein
VFSLFNTSVFVFRCISCCTTSLSASPYYACLFCACVYRPFHIIVRSASSSHGTSVSSIPLAAKDSSAFLKKKNFYVWGSSLVLSVVSFYRRSFCFYRIISFLCKNLGFLLPCAGFCFINPRIIFFPAFVLQGKKTL